MREILFKAKRVKDGEWIEGYYYKVQETVHCFKEDYEKKPVPIHHFIIFARTTDWELPMQTYQTEIIPETLCQFTGLTDKNGKKIWENDIVFVTDENDCSGQISTGIGDVIFIEGMWYIDGRPQEVLYDINKVFQIEVIGNAFDNQELLQEESDE